MSVALSMPAILLAAGLGTRLGPLARRLPKCMLPVNGRPLLEYWLRSLSAAGAGPVLINLHHQPQIVKAWLRQSEFEPHAAFVYEPELLGTGGTLLQNRDFVNHRPALLIHADNLCLADLETFVQAHFSRPAGTDITMMTFQTSTPQTCGIVQLDGRGVVRAFHEKVESPPGNLANAAVYILEPEILEFLKTLDRGPIDFSTQVLPCFLGRIFTWHNEAYHRDIGTLEDYLAAQIECPEPARMPAGTDAWGEICRQDQEAVSRHILAALARALRAEVTDVAGGNLKGAGRNRPGPVIFHIRDAPQQALAALGRRDPIGNSLLFFSRVAAGFSSKEIFERYGWKSLAVCAAS